VDQILVGLALLSMGTPSFPHTVGDSLHIQVFAVPEIKITDHTDCLSVGRPNTEHKAVYAVPVFGMATQKFISMGADTVVIVVQEGGKFFSHRHWYHILSLVETSFMGQTL
jgi:hypothetical protein